ncbi:MAG TPA: tRNA dimethylallyltransferase, partial [Bdellovibrio sp.]|nr:tRNA dimethylallyltransferase [Bdellovibrio sp.]
KGMYPVTSVPEEIKEQIAKELTEEGGPERLREELKKIDPEYAAKIHEPDHYRLGRAVELIRSQNKSVTQIQKEFAEKQTPFPYPLLKMGPTWDREILRERIQQRTTKMLTQGLITEVQNLLDEGLASWAPMSSVGYKECLQFLRGEFDEIKLQEEIAKNTAQLAKRQRTWFQRDKEIHWLEGSSGYPEARTLVENFLKT